jgi:hypothetical protein
VATGAQPDQSLAALIAPGRSGGSRSASTAREVSAPATVAEKAAVAKVAADKAATTKAAEEAMVKVAADVAVMKTADQGAAGAKTTMESTHSDSGSYPALPVGSKRAAAPGSSTSPSKRFRCTWKPWYVE